MANAWTGGQYSLLRAALGLSLAPYFAGQAVLGWAGPAERALAATAVLAALALAFGCLDRWAALFLAVAWFLRAYPLPRHELATPAVGFLLLVHAAQMAAPFGSWQARGRVDPGGGWRFRPPLYLAAWVALSVVHTAAGVWTLRAQGTPPTNPVQAALAWALLGLQLAFVPLALLPRLRPWLWLSTLGLQIALSASGAVDLSLGMVMLHLFTFDPAWVPRRAGAIETLFYDGSCGLCHRAVRFLLAEDPDGAAFAFAPLGSDTFRTRISEAERAQLPDSLVLLTADGRALTRSAAFRHLMERLGGTWRMFATVLRAVPARVQDAAYDVIARVRYRLFARPKDACPILPPHLRTRFMA